MQKTHTRFIAAVTALLLPCTAMAAVMLDVSDSVAGVGLTVGMRGAKPAESVDIVVSDPDGYNTVVPVLADNSGEAVAMIPGTKAQTAGTYTITARQKGSAVASVEADVHADSVDAAMSQMVARDSQIAADGRDQAIVEVTLRDQYGNILSGRPVSLIAGRKSDIVTPLTPDTDDTGTQEFSVRTTENGTVVLRAIDLLSTVTLDETAMIQAGSMAMGGNSVYTASTLASDSGKKFYFNAQAVSSFDVIDHFEIDAPTQMTAGEEAPKITVRAVDRNGTTVENYLGTIRFVTTDPEATVPNFGTYTFRDRDLGVKSFPLALTFRTNGVQTLRIEDENDPSISGETDITVGGQGTVNNGGSISITSHADGDYVNALQITVTGVGPRFANLIVMGGAEDAYGTTDEIGAFSIPVNLSPGQRDFTIRVRDDAGRNDSGQLHLILDQDAPVIDLVQFSPENPEEGEKVLVVVESETDLAEVSVRVPDRVNGQTDSVMLAANPAEPSTYQGFFTAPVPDVYQVTVSATDAAGNTTDLSSQLVVGGKTLPKVQGLAAEAKIDAVDLTWDPVPGAVDGYRIYIGTDGSSSDYALNTGKDTTKATVKGLTQGQEYTFAVTALRGDMESEEKSDPVTSRVLGFKLEVTPGDGALRVTWTSLASDLPLSSFVMEYGTDEASLTESRTLNGELRDTVIRDLINGVPYFIRVTPVTITGDTLDELSATGEGTPDGTGFKPGPRDDVPFDIPELPEGPLHSGAPQNPTTGVPAGVWMTLLGIAAAGVYLRWRHRKSVAQTTAFLQAVQAQYRM